MRRSLALIVIGLALWQCGETHPPPSTAESKPSVQSGSELGSWYGYVEHSDFDGEQGRIGIELSRVGGALTGKVKFGDGPPDPEPAPDLPGDGGASFSGAQPAVTPRLGFEYAIYKPRQEGERLRFHVELGDTNQTWCEQQRARTHLEGTDEWGCPTHGTFRSGQRCTIVVPRAAGMPDAGRLKPIQKGDGLEVPCELLQWCSELSSACHCRPQGCVARPGAQIAFDLTLRGSELEGSIAMANGVRNVRLKRK